MIKSMHYKDQEMGKLLRLLITSSILASLHKTMFHKFILKKGNPH